MIQSHAETVIAALAVDHGLLAPVDAVQIIKEARATGNDPVAELVRTNRVPLRALLAATAQELGLELVDLFGADRGLRTSAQLLARCDEQWLDRLSFIPMQRDDGTVVVAASNPGSQDLLDALDATFGAEGYELALATADQIDQLLLSERSRQFSNSVEAEAAEQGPAAAEEEALADVTRNSPVLQWLEAQLLAAVAARASDLHFEIAHDGSLLTRFRIDGDLQAQRFPHRGKELEVIGALMARAGMDTADTRRPQDGSFTITVNKRKIDSRVAMIRLASGPKVVVRLLDPSNLKSLADLGFSNDALDMMLGTALRPQGLIIVAGPTGSGKTTTLYALLEETKKIERNVMTIENPVEYRLPLVSQIPVTAARADGRSVTFASALRTVLRLDPDVILVGEIRDSETAQTALDAAITGHMVLSTVHAPSAIGVFTRLIEMGAPSYLVADALSLSVSQRLVKRVHSCATERPATPEEVEILSQFGLAIPEVVKEPQGCAGCRLTGHLGRIAVVEMCAPNDEVRHLVATRAPSEQIETAARTGGGYLSMVTQVDRLLATGETTPTEVLRALTLQ
jgi:type II secretory ATPase GspE/PulE/Tfp pilus assembly ATPase PilB-like protein